MADSDDRACACERGIGSAQFRDFQERPMGDRIRVLCLEPRGDHIWQRVRGQYADGGHIKCVYGCGIGICGAR